MAAPSPSESSAGTDSDQDFDPSADMLVNDFDDEHTLDEEEALLEAELGTKDEIDELTKEGNMPMEELLALYGYANPSKAAEKPSENNEVQASDSSNSNSNSVSASTSHPKSSLSNPKSANIPTSSSFGNLSDSDSGEDSEENFSANEDEWRRTIQVGSNFQAPIPEGLNRYEDSSSIGSNDLLVWKPTHSLKTAQINDYLIEYAKASLSDDEFSYGDFVLPSGAHIKDDEQALFLLYHCKYNIADALKSHEKGTEPIAPLSEFMTPWSEEECRAFENGLRSFGKDFFQIKRQRVDTRSVGEIIQFYYLWKKTERHDLFAAKFRIEKKRYALHPGTTDYMDRFLDEQENFLESNPQLTSQTNSSLLSSSRSLLNDSSSHHHHISMSGSTQSSSNSRQSSNSHHINMANNSAQSRSNNNSSNNHSVYMAGNNSHNSSTSVSGHHNSRTINVTASGSPQTILIDDSDFNGTDNHNKSVVVRTGSGSSSSSNSSHSNKHHHHNHHNYYGTNSSSFKHPTQSSSSSLLPNNTKTIVVGKNPIVIDGNWVSSSPTSSTFSTSSSSSSNNFSTPSVSIYKIPNSSTYNHHR